MSRASEGLSQPWNLGDLVSWKWRWWVKRLDAGMSWSTWRNTFQDNFDVELPKVERGEPSLDQNASRSLANTFAVFQLGETGEGRIVSEVERFCVPSVDDDWRASIRMCIREEGRHGRVLGDCARALGGKPIATNWTNSLFVSGRRLLGVRLKLLVIFASEVVGIIFYGLIARALPEGEISRALLFIVRDEERHLAFHKRFFALETRVWWRRLIFSIAWAFAGLAAGVVVLIDHGRTLRLLEIRRSVAMVAFARLLFETAKLEQDSSPNAERNPRASALAATERG